MNPHSLISLARQEFHRGLLKDGILTIDKDGIPNIADKGSKQSIGIAQQMVKAVGSASTSVKAAGQTSGKEFESAVADFLRNTFLKLGHLRPGSWEVSDQTTGGSVEISNFEQYEHLRKLREVIEADPQLAAALGSDYLITPDVVVLRSPEPDERINAVSTIVDDESARHTSLRAKNHGVKTRFVKGKPVPHETVILHASVSCKWTLRSDRAQNARSEALNLIRNRKGRVPHIVAVTAEPLPSRIASLALGTSDLDCVYHIALAELLEAVKDQTGGVESDQFVDLNTLVNGKRLRDISDLPLDLVI